jgi:hypothetical protein
MKLTLLLPALLLAGCTTVVPVTSKWPNAPGVLVQQPCPQLQKLPENSKLSDVATTVVQNYTQYYECAVKLEAWQRWYSEQQTIHEGLK